MELEKYRKYVKQCTSRGISCIPVNQDKTPIGKWNQWQERLITDREIDEYFNEDVKLAWVGGAVSGDGGTLVCIDLDEKYNLEGRLIRKLWALLPKELTKKLLVAQTQNNGYHIIFRSPKQPQPAQKLANRETTAEEKNITYVKYRNQGKSKEEAKTLAEKDKVRVLIETRESKSYFLVYPTTGYSLIKGKLHTITAEEHDLILEAARSLNEYNPPVNDHKRVRTESKFTNKGDSPFAKFDENGDVLKVLASNGWQVKKSYGNAIPLKRPGDSSALKSADYYPDNKTLVVYSTSTIFPTGECMSPSYVYTLLEHNGDWAAAATALAKLGYGKASYQQLGKYATAMKDLLEEISMIVLEETTEDILKFKDKLITSITNLKQKYEAD